MYYNKQIHIIKAIKNWDNNESRAWIGLTVYHNKINVHFPKLIYNEMIAVHGFAK